VTFNVEFTRASRWTLLRLLLGAALRGRLSISPRKSSPKPLTFEIKRAKSSTSNS
jgi:hypothetical protein